MKKFSTFLLGMPPVGPVDIASLVAAQASNTQTCPLNEKKATLNETGQKVDSISTPAKAEEN